MHGTGIECPSIGVQSYCRYVAKFELRAECDSVEVLGANHFLEVAPRHSHLGTKKAI